MNYFPYFRGKQYELICLRENAELIAEIGFTPIIEPVKENVDGLVRALDVLKDSGASFLVVANPSVGHHKHGWATNAIETVAEVMDDYEGAGWIFHAESDGDLPGMKNWLKTNEESAVLHSGRISSRTLLELLDEFEFEDRVHVFGRNCSTRYRSTFKSSMKILLEDGFRKTKNADYPEVELFSELPITFAELGATGFGDYLIVGEEYSEGGGAAYAVAIHLTYPDPDEGGAIYVRHFVSDSNDTTSDPAGKFREALAKLVEHCQSRKSKIPKSRAVTEYYKLYESGHFPGLGYVKKLSMQHHLEIMRI